MAENARVAAGKQDYDAEYHRLLVIPEHVKCEYVRHFRAMVDKLSVSHLEPLAKVLLECENCLLLGKDEVLRAFKENLLDRLETALDDSWQECNISTRLVTLEMLKERFKDYEGGSWNIKEMPPHERILPLRMRYKEATKKYLQKQIVLQKSKLGELFEATNQNRSRIQDIRSNRRVHLKKAVENLLKKWEGDKAKMQELQLWLLNNE